MSARLPMLAAIEGLLLVTGEGVGSTCDLCHGEVDVDDCPRCCRVRDAVEFVRTTKERPQYHGWCSSCDKQTWTGGFFEDAIVGPRGTLRMPRFLCPDCAGVR